MQIFLAPLVTLIGLVMYVLAGNPKLAEIGRILFAFGLLVTLWQFSGGHSLKVL